MKLVLSSELGGGASHFSCIHLEIHNNVGHQSNIKCTTLFGGGGVKYQMGEGEIYGGKLTLLNISSLDIIPLIQWYMYPPRAPHSSKSTCYTHLLNLLGQHIRLWAWQLQSISLGLNNVDQTSRCIPKL